MRWGRGAFALLIGRDHTLVSRVLGIRGWNEGPTRECLLEVP